MDREICGWMDIGLFTTIEEINCYKSLVRTWLWLPGSVAK